MRGVALVTLTSVLLLGGCSGLLPSASEQTSEPSSDSSKGAAGQLANDETGQDAPAKQEPVAEGSKGGSGAGAERPKTRKQKDLVAVKAKPGVGIAGRSLDNEEGILVTPAKTLFAVGERMVFEVQIPQALQLFQATEGRKPSSHEEFMSRIVEANRIRLPALPAGHKYQYYPDRGELMVIRPR